MTEMQILILIVAIVLIITATIAYSTWKDSEKSYTLKLEARNYKISKENDELKNTLENINKLIKKEEDKPEIVS